MGCTESLGDAMQLKMHSFQSCKLLQVNSMCQNLKEGNISANALQPM